MAIARYNNTGYIVIMGQDRYLYAFNSSGSFLHKSNVMVTKHTTGAYDFSSLLNIADFNGDGIPEVYTGNQIFSLDGLAQLCSGANNNHGILNLSTYGQFHTVAIDMDNDGKPELCAGTQIYKVTIPAGATTSTGCSMSVITGMELPATQIPSNAVKDGATQVADIDDDGILEVIVVSAVSGNKTTVYVWKPLPNNQSYCMGYYQYTSGGLYSIPMIGNIDSDKYPEIVLIGTGSRMYALKFNPDGAGNQIGLKWELSHSDGSACTGMSLFDFNQDGRNEIVYRDQTLLRIINGDYSLGGMLPSTCILSTFDNVTSGTLREFPVIADVDNDGQAEIIVSGHTGSQGGNGYVRVFKTDGSPWAPARKVWNQYAYNSVNVNDDLTIPTVQFNPATVFPGPDGQLGTSDDVRPYNNYMQQQTTLSKNGTPYLEASDYAIEGIPTTLYDPDNDVLTINVCVRNYGDVQGTPPFYISVYKNARLSGNVVKTESYSNIPAPGQTTCTNYSIIVNNVLDVGLDIRSLHLWLNDNGGGKSINPECDSINGVVIYDVTGDVEAKDDYASIFVCGEAYIPILDNDEYAGTTFTILNSPVPKYGTVTQLPGGLLHYDHNGGTCEQTGNRTDTIRYGIQSIISSAVEANVIVKIYNKPGMMLEDSCSVNPKIVLSNSYDGFTYEWEHSSDGASGWEVIPADNSATKLGITQVGFYRVTIYYDNGKTHRLDEGLEVVANKTVQLPGGITWYELSSDTVNITWQ
jgi:hypothetical protein